MGFGTRQGRPVRALRSLAVLLLAVLWVAPGAAQIYKYTDSKGLIHYTNVKPSGHIKVKVFNFPCYASDPSCRSIDWEKVPLNTQAFSGEIHAAAERNHVDEALIRAIIQAESAYQPRAESPKGAQGLMQLMPDTQTELQVTNPWDPAQNIAGGASYLAQMLSQFDGDVKLATAAYHAGAGAVHSYKGVPPFPETREYIRRVEILQRRYRQLLR